VSGTTANLIPGEPLDTYAQTAQALNRAVGAVQQLGGKRGTNYQNTYLPPPRRRIGEVRQGPTPSFRGPPTGEHHVVRDRADRR